MVYWNSSREVCFVRDMLFTEYMELLERKEKTSSELASLPQGYISRKTINGKEYRYLQARVAGKMVSTYLKGDEVDKVVAQIAKRKAAEAELPKINDRIVELERAAKFIGRGADRRLMLLKMSIGMDSMDTEQKKSCVSFAAAMNAIEGVPVSDQTSKDIADWQNGKKTYLAVFRTVLRRYGFSEEV